MAGGKMINIGCGTIHHPDWINLDIASDDPTVLTVDITRGLPFTEASISACYSSHVLEHMDHAAARFMLKECFRVLQGGGILRLAVPDLETIAREYLALLDRVIQGDTVRVSDYDWIMLEMYDQVARSHSGGDMAPFLNNLAPHRRKYVLSRIGCEAARIWGGEPIELQNVPKRWGMSLMKRRFNRYRLLAAKLAVRLVGGKSAAASFERGVFRDSGEIHQWMYDRYSLKRLLEQMGFSGVSVCQASESRIPDFAKYSLDVVNGEVRKPDSLFIEAIKP